MQEIAYYSRTLNKATLSISLFILVKDFTFIFNSSLNFIDYIINLNFFLIYIC